MYLEPSPVWGNAINLVVENLGTTVATDVRFKFSKPLASKARTGDLNEVKLLKEGIRSMPPRMRYATLLDLSHVRIKSDLPMSYDVEISFAGRSRKRERLSYNLDMSLFYGLEGFREYGIHHAAKALMEIAKRTEAWTGTQQRLKVWVADEDYEAWSDRWQADRGGTHPSMGRPYPALRRSPSPFDKLREPRMRALFYLLAVRVDQIREKGTIKRLARSRPDLALARLMHSGRDRP